MRRVRYVPAVIAFAACCATATPAGAVPGQTISSFRTWSGQQKLLRGLTSTHDEMSGLPAFALTMSDHGIAWTFRALTDGKAVRSESLSVGSGGTDTGNAIRHDGSGYGFTFWSRVYGPAIAHDFRTSRAVFASTDAVNHEKIAYFRGSRFGYVAANGELRVETLVAFAQEVATARVCAVHPDRCRGD